MGIDWKKLSHVVVAQHMVYGAASVFLDGTPAFSVKEDEERVELSDLDFLEVPGKEITPKQVRRYLWKHRKLKEDHIYVWSVYDEKGDKSAVGLARIEKNTHGEEETGNRHDPSPAKRLP